jgi:hypothetical protein
MGFTPDQVWRMSLWEFGAAWSGWKKANTSPPEQARFPTPEEHAENLRRLQHTIH